MWGAVSGPLLEEKANQIALFLGHQNFLCSDGWLGRFKKRREIAYRVISGKANAVPESIA